MSHFYLGIPRTHLEWDSILEKLKKEDISRTDQYKFIKWNIENYNDQMLMWIKTFFGTTDDDFEHELFIQAADFLQQLENLAESHSINCRTVTSDDESYENKTILINYELEYNKNLIHLSIYIYIKQLLSTMNLLKTIVEKLIQLSAFDDNYYISESLSYAFINIFASYSFQCSEMKEKCCLLYHPQYKSIYSELQEYRKFLNSFKRESTIIYPFIIRFVYICITSNDMFKTFTLKNGLFDIHSTEKHEWFINWQEQRYFGLLKQMFIPIKLHQIIPPTIEEYDRTPTPYPSYNVSKISFF